MNIAPPRASIKFAVTGPGHDLHLAVLLNGETYWQGVPEQQSTDICLDIEDTDGEHVMEIVMSGKTRRHTQLDAQGNIVNDAVLKCQDFFMDDIQIDNIIWNLAEYQHDYNGSGTPITDRFYGIMGCNGRVTLRFHTPAYLWLLENI